MTILDLTIGRIINLIENINKLLFETPFEILKALGFLFSLLITFLMILFWIKFEKETKTEINYWKRLIKNIKDFQSMKNFPTTFDKIKKMYYQNKNLALIEVDQFLNFTLETFGYEGNLDEKLNKVPATILLNLEEIKKAHQIVKIIKEKLANNEEIPLTDDEYLMIFHEYEKALYNLNILTTENFLVNFLK